MDRIASLPGISDIAALLALWQALDAARRARPDVSPQQLPEVNTLLDEGLDKGALVGVDRTMDFQ